MIVTRKNRGESQSSYPRPSLEVALEDLRSRSEIEECSLVGRATGNHRVLGMKRHDGEDVDEPGVSQGIVHPWAGTERRDRRR